MALETGTYISDLVSTNPAGTDTLDKADDHLRLIKSTVKATFPNIAGAVTPTHTELNFVDGVTSAIQTQLDAKAPLASPTFTGVAAVQAGSAALPSLVPTGDTNTGFWFPAADTVAVSTAGVERMRFKADATIGISTSTTNAKLQIDVADYPLNPIVTITNGASYGMFLNPGNSTILKAGFGTYTNTTLGILTNNVERMTIDASGNVLVTSSGGLGYGTGSGGTVTQAGSNTAGVALNKTNGQIVMFSGSLASSNAIRFTVTNSTVVATDNIIVTIATGGANTGTTTGFLVGVDSVSAGSFNIYVRNMGSATQSTALTINFAIIKATTS